MKKTLLIFALLVSTAAFSQTSIDYPGNGKENFGGAVGKGSLNITETTDAVSFTLTRGTGLFDSLIVFYLDAQAGGITTTAGLSGSNTDPYLAAVAGHNPSTGRAILNFAADFQPDAAIAFDKNGGKVFYFISIGGFTVIQEGTSFSITPSGTNSAATYTQQMSKTDLGLSGALNFKFLGNYIGKSASRSNEAFGDPFNTYSRPTNTSSYNSYTTTSYFTFQSSSTLPVKLVDLKAVKQQGAVNINWSVADETNIDQYEVQRSANGVSFSTIATVKAKNSAIFSNYSVNDLSAPAGLNYYRVIIIERGKMEISKIISLNIDGGKIGFKANLSAPRTLLLTLNSLNAGTYKLSVLNNNGQVVQVQNIQVDGSAQIKQVQLNQNINKGIYRLMLRSATERYATNILVQ